MKRLRYSIIINREIADVLAEIVAYQQLLPPEQGGYSVEAVGQQTRITFTSNQPIRALYSLDETSDDPLGDQIQRLSRLKQKLEAADHPARIDYARAS